MEPEEGGQTEPVVESVDRLVVVAQQPEWPDWDLVQLVAPELGQLCSWY